MIPRHAEAVQLLWREFQRSARQAIAARYFRWWRRHAWLQRHRRQQALDQLQRRDRVLRVAVVRQSETRLRRGLDAFRHHAADFRAKCRALDALAAKQIERNAVRKWHRMARHERFEEEVVAQAWVLHHRRAVKHLLRILLRWRKRRLCRGLAQWQLHAQAGRWWQFYHDNTDSLCWDDASLAGCFNNSLAV